MAAERVTVTVPAEVLAEVDRLERNRSRFIVEAIRRELERRHMEALRRSLAHPHHEGSRFIDEDFAAWAGSLPLEDVSELLDDSAATPVKWTPGEGWIAG